MLLWYQEKAPLERGDVVLNKGTERGKLTSRPRRFLGVIPP